MLNMSGLLFDMLDLSDEILESDLPDDPLLEPELLRYFPAALRESSPNFA